MAKSNKIPKDDFEENPDDYVCYLNDEGVEGKCLSHFVFDQNNNIVESNDLKTSTINEENTNKEPLNKNNTSPSSSINAESFVSHINSISTSPYKKGSACIINDEAPTVRRSYIMRESTIRKIAELKSLHPDINTCFSTIVDQAIEFYYNSFFD